MSKIPFIDCQGLAGAWTLGTVRTGAFELVGRKTLPGGFGDTTVEANRQMLGFGWDTEVGQLDDWAPEDGIGFVCGTPPCSGFSLLNTAKGANKRGAGSTINACMRELIEYSARKVTGLDGKRGPEVVAFESVQGAYSQGRSLMVDFLGILRERTGEDYKLHHVLMSGSTIGAAQMRHRYFPVFARVPFGVDEPQLADLPGGRVVSYGDAIDDLSGRKMTWAPQRYNSKKPSAFAQGLRSPSGTFQNHVTIDHGRLVGLLKEVAERGWEGGDDLVQAVLKIEGFRPEAIAKQYDPSTDTYRGWSWPVRVRKDRPGYVLTGGGIHGFVHYQEPRLLTVAECSRLMGYPDDWVWPTTSPNQASMLIGKCCPVGSGEWISARVARAITGAPGAEGAALSEHERYFNFTNLYKNWPGGDVSRRGRRKEAA